MNSELVKQIMDLAFELSAPRQQPRRVELRTKSRAEKIRLELMTLYNAEPKSTSKRLVARHNRLSISKIRWWKSQTVKAGMLESMIGFLVSAVWGKSSFSDTERETAIQAAVKALPDLCEKLQAVDGESIPNQTAVALVLKQATSSRLFGVKNRAAANGNEQVAGITLS